jgi:hypothetical protein
MSKVSRAKGIVKENLGPWFCLGCFQYGSELYKQYLHQGEGMGLTRKGKDFHI